MKQNLLTDARISSTDLTHLQGFAFSLCVSMKDMMSAMSVAQGRLRSLTDGEGVLLDSASNHQVLGPVRGVVHAFAIVGEILDDAGNRRRVPAGHVAQGSDHPVDAPGFGEQDPAKVAPALLSAYAVLAVGLVRGLLEALSRMPAMPNSA